MLILNVFIILYCNILLSGLELWRVYETNLTLRYSTMPACQIYMLKKKLFWEKNVRAIDLKKNNIRFRLTDYYTSRNR